MQNHYWYRYESIEVVDARPPVLLGHNGWVALYYEH